MTEAHINSAASYHMPSFCRICPLICMQTDCTRTLSLSFLYSQVPVAPLLLIRLLRMYSAFNSFPELTETRACRMTTCGAMGVAGFSLCKPLATCRSFPETSSPYRNRSIKKTIAEAAAQSWTRMEARKAASAPLVLTLVLCRHIWRFQQETIQHLLALMQYRSHGILIIHDDYPPSRMN